MQVASTPCLRQQTPLPALCVHQASEVWLTADLLWFCCVLRVYLLQYDDWQDADGEDAELAAWGDETRQCSPRAATSSDKVCTAAG